MLSPQSESLLIWHCLAHLKSAMIYTCILCCGIFWLFCFFTVYSYAWQAWEKDLSKYVGGLHWVTLQTPLSLFPSIWCLRRASVNARACVFVRTFEHPCVSLFLYMCYSASEENLLSVPLSSSAVPAALYYLSAAEVKWEHWFQLTLSH